MIKPTVVGFVLLDVAATLGVGSENTCTVSGK